MPALQGRELAESTVLDVDGAIVELDASDGKIPMQLGKADVRRVSMAAPSRAGGNRDLHKWFLTPTLSSCPSTEHCYSLVNSLGTC